MIVTKDTKISKIINENKDAIDVIASINKHFKKLKNPVLRKVLAPRVTVKDAARIGKTEVAVFLEKLEAIGFKVAHEESPETANSKSNNNLETLNLVELDVRPTINSGADPFKEIMGAVKKMKEDETLKIINIFEPIPLIKILKEKGYKTWTDEINANEFHTFFKKEANITHQEVVENMPISEGSFDEKLLTFGGNIKEIDVSLLEMPEPMVNILKEIETLPEGHVLFVNHKKIPQFLLPELKSRGFTWMHKEISSGDTKLIIFKA